MITDVTTFAGLRSTRSAADFHDSISIVFEPLGVPPHAIALIEDL